MSPAFLLVRVTEMLILSMSSPCFESVVYANPYIAGSSLKNERNPGPIAIRLIDDVSQEDLLHSSRVPPVESSKLAGS